MQNAMTNKHNNTPISPSFLEFILQEHEQLVLPKLEMLWDYYRNDLTQNASTATRSPGDNRAYSLAQERGLPDRLKTTTSTNHTLQSRPREKVIENDIAWRIHALVDFMFGKPFVLQSLAPTLQRANIIETFLRHVLESNGGMGFFNDLALLGSVHGHVDVLLRTNQVQPSSSDDKALFDSLRHQPSHPDSSASSLLAADSSERPSTPDNDSTVSETSSPGDASSSLPGGQSAHLLATAHHLEHARGSGTVSFNQHNEDELEAAKLRLLQLADRMVLETIEAPRAVPILNPSDYRKMDAYLVHYRQVLNEVENEGLMSRVRDSVLGTNTTAGRRALRECTEVWSAESFQQFAADSTTSNGNNRKAGRCCEHTQINRLGRIPVVHIQNLPQPFFYEGLSDVEPLIPLQDELNTRLSDRANRVTFQSFKMYLGKGIDKFLDRPVGPGQMWATDNPDASIESFGGDGASPSEEAHINEIREAMDKISAIIPLAAGVIRDRVGNLTSENALRVTMIGMLSRTQKKRMAYGAGIEQICELILHAADVLGVLPNTPDERNIRIDWPSPIPESESDKLRDAKVKLDLGVSTAQVLAELGYGQCSTQ